MRKLIVLLLFIASCGNPSEVYTYKVIGVNNPLQVTYYDIESGQHVDTVISDDLHVFGYSFGLSKYHIYCSDPAVDLYFTVSSDGQFFTDKSQLELTGYYKFK